MNQIGNTKRTAFLKQNKMKIIFLLIIEIFLFATLGILFYCFSPLRLYNKLLICVGIAGIFFVTFTYITVVIKKTGLDKVFFVVAMIMGGLYMYMIPLNTVPDEAAHIRTTYAISNQMMGIADSDTGITMRADDYNYGYANKDFTMEKYEKYFHDIFSKVHDSELIETELIPLETPRYQYFLPAVGITIGRLLGLGTVPVFLLGRFMNLLFWSLCVAYAIKKIPFGKMILFVISLMPMAIQQGASFSYDSFINSMFALVLALTLYILYGKEKIHKYEWGILALASVLLMFVKSHTYFLIALLPILIVIRNWKNNRKKACLGLGIIIICFTLVAGKQIVGVIQSASDNNTQIENSLNESEHEGNYIEWAQYPGYELKDLMNPKLLIRIIYSTIDTNLEFYVDSFIGKPMGWVEIPLSQIFIYIYLAMIMLVSFKRKNEVIELSRIDRAYLLIAGTLSSAFVFAGMLMEWTPNCFTVIQGVQGRYFLPAIPLLLYAVRSKKIEVDESIDKKIIMGIVLTLFFINLYILGWIELR